MKKLFDVIRHELYDGEEVDRFMSYLTDATADGFSIESCGIGGDTCRMGWAIMSKPVDAKPAKIDLVEAALTIAKACKANKDGCQKCPLSKGSQCLAGGALIPAYWPVTKE